jgi:hypothetical protein
VLLALTSVVASVSAVEETTGLKSPTAAVPLPGGGFLVADYLGCTVEQGDAGGTLSPFAGTGTCGTTGDGGPATAANLSNPTVAARTADGSTLIATPGFVGFSLDCRVRKVDGSGNIATVAGSGPCGYTGDGGPATSAQINVISVVPYNAPGQAVQTPGEGFLIAGGCAVRKVNAANVISTLAGQACPGQNTFLSAVSCVTGLCVAAGGSGRTNSTTTPAVRHSWVFRQPGLANDSINDASCPTATTCALSTVEGVVLFSTNADSANPTWSRYDITPGNTLLASVWCVSATLCLAGDYQGAIRVTNNPGAAPPTWTPTTLDQEFPSTTISAVTCTPAASLCAAVGGGDIFTTTTPAPGGAWAKNDLSITNSFTSVSCPATTLCVAGTTASGTVYVSTNPTAGAAATWTATSIAGAGPEIRSVSCPTTALCVGVDSAGNSVTSTDPAAGTWTVRKIHNPPGGLSSVSCASATLCVAVGNQYRLITTNPADANPQWVSTDAFDPQLDGVPATSQPLNKAISAVPTADGGFLVAEYGAHRIRKVTAGGTSTTVAGNGTPGFSGDGGQATAAQLYQPTAAVPTPDGGFLLADMGNCVVRKVTQGGVITTIAGLTPTAGPTRRCGTSGTGGPATSAELYYPSAAVPYSDGSYLIGTYGDPPSTGENDTPLNMVTAAGTLVLATDPTAEPTVSPTATPTATPAPDPDPSPAPTAPPTPPPGLINTPPLPRATPPNCTLKAGSPKVKLRGKATLKVTARCTQAASVSLGGTITVTARKKKPKKVKLTTVRGAAKANAPLVLTLKVPKSVVTALKRKAKASASFSLTATGTGGVTTATARLAKLRGTR